jgi:hypothetical protein
MIVYLNGHKIAEGHDDRSSKGVVGMQVHDRNATVRFKDIKVKPYREPGMPGT